MKKSNILNVYFLYILDLNQIFPQNSVDLDILTGALLDSHNHQDFQQVQTTETQSTIQFL